MKKKIDNITYVLIAEVALLLVSLFGYGYMFLNVRDKAEHAVQITEAYDAEIGKDTRQTALRTTLRETKDKVSKLDTYFLRGDTISEFTTNIEGLGALTGTEITTSTIFPKGDTVMSATFSVEGSFASVLQVLTLFENLPYKVEVKSVSLGFLGNEVVQGEVPSGKQSDTAKVSAGPKWKAVVSFEIMSYIKR